MKKKCWLIGAGYMAKEYYKVLKDLNLEIIVVGNSVENLNKFEINESNTTKISGGFEAFIRLNNSRPDFFINAVSTEFLFETTLLAIKSGVKNILLEKPGALSVEDLQLLKSHSDSNKCKLYIAYNRRFYSSVQKLKEEVLIDGGIKSVNFEFTEWIDTIDTNKYPKSVLNKFLICNSTHVIDLVFYIIGKPSVLNSQVLGDNLINWHNNGSIFMGFGVSCSNIPFSYSSNWLSAGRWGVEILTSKRRFYLKPLEILQYQNINSLDIKQQITDNNLDLNFKPGLYKMINNFLQENDETLCNIEEHLLNYEFYMQMGGYQF